ncbi:hypothetical protein B4U80_02533 [Leptotrombidium deliense]|uniref:Uncharacterized protein n=1 Tax=Leptotrombidium deliense TaxID=299467 RepID=A0A443S3T7_9ACAR|nr:hypothetical protein B4U80_02533 [Leptotrombidium deliense]
MVTAREFHLQSDGEDNFMYNVRCPPPEDIHPCKCIEFEKGMENEFLESEEVINKIGYNTTEIQISFEEEIGSEEQLFESQPHPDTIETLVFCRHIRHRQVLHDALKGFRGHRVNHFVLDSCTLPPFPNNLLNNINILWMEIVNSTVVLQHAFLNCAEQCL